LNLGGLVEVIGCIGVEISRNRDISIENKLAVTSGETQEEGQYRGEAKRVIMKLYEIMYVKLLKILKHYRNFKNLSSD